MEIYWTAIFAAAALDLGIYWLASRRKWIFS